MARSSPSGWRRRKWRRSPSGSASCLRPRTYRTQPPRPTGPIHLRSSPASELFRVGLLAIGWDQSTLTVEARPIDEAGEYAEVGDDDPDGPDVVRVQLSPQQGVEFVRVATTLVAAGRPACPFCGQPLDPAGHFCPASNAHLN